MLGIRKAGEAMRALDDAYSAKIAQMYGNGPAQAAAYMVGGAHPSLRLAEPVINGNESKLEQLLGEVSRYAIPAANAVPKYVLPATGVALGGIAVNDLLSILGKDTEAREQEMIDRGVIIN